MLHYVLVNGNKIVFRCLFILGNIPHGVKEITVFALGNWCLTGNSYFCLLYNSCSCLVASNTICFSGYWYTDLIGDLLFASQTRGARRYLVFWIHVSEFDRWFILLICFADSLRQQLFALQSVSTMNWRRINRALIYLSINAFEFCLWSFYLICRLPCNFQGFLRVISDVILKAFKGNLQPFDMFFVGNLWLFFLHRELRSSEQTC